jgi:hypothetical protein
VPRRSRPTTSASTSRRRVRAPLCRTARVGRDLRRDGRSATPRGRFDSSADLPRCRAPGVTVLDGDEQEAPWSDEVLDRDAISVLIIEPGARGSAIARSETTAPSLCGRTDSSLGARRGPLMTRRARSPALSARSSAVRSERRSRSPGPRPRGRARGLAR